MRIVIIVLAVVLLLLQVELWRQVGQIGELRRQVDAQLEQNASLQERNDALAAEVADLKSGLDAVEERARAELGLVRDGERFYLVVDPDDLPEGQSEAVRLLEALPEEPPPADAIDAEPDGTGPVRDGNG